MKASIAFFLFNFGPWGLSSLTRDRIEAPPALEGRVLAIGPPGKSQHPLKELFEEGMTRNQGEA